MLRFEPQGYINTLEEVFDSLEQLVGYGIHELFEDVPDPREEDFDPADYDEIVISGSMEIEFRVPYSYDFFTTLTLDQLELLTLEMENAVLEDNARCWTFKRVLVHVGLVDYSTIKLLEGIYEKSYFDDFLPSNTMIDGIEVKCTLARGVTPFGLLVLKEGNFSKHYPAVVEDDLFVNITSSSKLTRDQVDVVLNAYIFELDASLGIVLQSYARPIFEEYPQYEDDDEDAIAGVPIMLRPLVEGPGVLEILSIYNSAISTSEPVFQILGLVKVIEFVSQTVIKSGLMEAVRMKLLSARAINPNADFILELQSVFDEQKIFQKDREAIRITIKECCDAHELASVAPVFLKELKQIGVNSTIKERTLALSKLAGSISATRNWIAHAKANYKPTGEECPGDQLEQFAKCVRIAAQQVVRWYSTRHHTLRVT